VNVAFPALLTFLLILPGFIFRSAFTRSEKTQLDSRPYTSETVKSLILATILHTIWINAAHIISSATIDYHAFLSLLTFSRGEPLENAVRQASTEIPFIVKYFLSIYVGSYLLGTLAQKSVIKYKLDRHPILSDLSRFDTPWFYLFKGFNDDADGADFVKLAVTLPHVGSTYLYYGILEDFFLTDDGQLERIVLSSVVRRKLEADDLITGNDQERSSDITHRFYEILGDRLILKYTDITSLNIEYYKIIDPAAS
jgi:hypothetical protein